jgi:tetratricopeptide (TPR) repeat protein
VAAAPPGDHAQALQQARTLRSEQKWDESEAAATAALARWPNDRDFMLFRAALSQWQLHWEQGHLRYAALRAQHPDHVFGWARDGEMLRRLKRPDEAEALLSQAEQRFPADEEVLVQWTLAACDTGNWQEAEARAEMLLARLPDNPASYRFAAEAFARREMHVEAELLVAEGLQRLGAVPVLSLRFAELAASRKDWTAAARRWATAVRQLPDHEAAHRGLARALREAGRLDEAEQALLAAGARFPDSFPLALELAWSANARGDWPTAGARWRALMARAPANGAVREGYETAMLQAGLRTPAVTELQPVAAAAVDPVPADLTRLMQDCDFGFVQRRSGVEALGLLRFASIGCEHLIAALDHDFAGVGEPPFTRVYLRDGQEYVTSDTRYALQMHSFTGPNQVSPEQFAQGAYRRFTFLARKMLDDLRTASRIYVRSAGSAPMSPADVLRLHAALRRHGDNTLLYVAPTDDARRVGRAEWVAPGVMHGWIVESSIDHANWRSVCRAAHGLWTARRAPGNASAQRAGDHCVAVPH